MSPDDPDTTEWQDFRVDRLNCKFKGAPTEDQMIDRFRGILHRGNKHALRYAEEARAARVPGKGMANPVYDGTHGLSAASPTTYRKGDDDIPWLYSGLDHLIDKPK